jgi:Leucine-rich repeat (LRR) protein
MHFGEQDITEKDKEVIDKHNFEELGYKAFPSSIEKNFLNLKTLNLGGSALEYWGLNHEKLRRLFLKGNNLIQVNLSLVPNLEFLNASDNKIKTIDLTNCNLLKDVDLSNNQIENISLPKDCTAEVNLIGNSLSKKYQEHLKETYPDAKFKFYLRTLDLSNGGKNVSEEMKNLIRNAFPNLDFDF